MENVVPPSLLFEFRHVVPQCELPSKKKSGRLLTLASDAPLFVPATLNDQNSCAEFRLGWHADGVGICVAVHGKTEVVNGSSADPDRSDSVKIWLDTRPSGNVHRATEYCHSFICLPADEQQDGRPSADVLPIAQQRATRVETNTNSFLLRTHRTKSGYELEVWIPGNQLSGYREIAETGRIGFHAVVHDTELGEQPFSVGSDFPTSYDPSTWTQMDLAT